MTGRQLELDPRLRATPGCSRCSGIGSSPGQDEPDGARGGAARARRRGSSVDRRARRRPRPRPAAGLQRPVRAADAGRRADDARRWSLRDGRAGRDRAAEPTAGEVDFGEPIGGRETIYTLHSEMLTFGELRLQRGQLPALALPGAADAAARACRRGRGGDRGRGARGLPRRARRSRCTSSRRGRRTRGHASRRSRGRRGAGASAAASSRRRRRRRLRCGCWRAGAVDARGALPPSAASTPTTMFAELEQRGCSFEVEGLARRSSVKVGVPTEIKADEYRVALTPAGVRELAEHGHEVLIQAGAGEGTAIADADYEAQGARIVPDAEAGLGRGRAGAGGEGAAAVGGRAAARRATAVHLPAPGAGARARPAALLRVRRRTASPTRRSRTPSGRLPLLAPMSEIAGKIATQAGAFMLERPLGGRGILLGGVPGVAAANVMVIGGGAVGMNAASIAIGMEADVFVFDISHRPPARARHRLRRARLDRLLLDAGDRGDAAAGRPGDRRGARARRAGAAS